MREGGDRLPLFDTTTSRLLTSRKDRGERVRHEVWRGWSLVGGEGGCHRSGRGDHWFPSPLHLRTIPLPRQPRDVLLQHEQYMITRKATAKEGDLGEENGILIILVRMDYWLLSETKVSERTQTVLKNHYKSSVYTKTTSVGLDASVHFINAKLKKGKGKSLISK